MNRLNAFTLIELLVVISIIALLIGILLPALGAARRTARWSVDLSNQRQFVIANVTWAVDNGGVLPVSYGYKTGPNGSAPDPIRATDPAYGEGFIPDWQGYGYARELYDNYGLPIASLNGCNSYEPLLIEDDMTTEDPNYSRASVVNRGNNLIWMNWLTLMNLRTTVDVTAQADGEPDAEFEFPRNLEDQAGTETISTCRQMISTTQPWTTVPHLQGYSALDRVGGVAGQPVDTGVRLPVRDGRVDWSRAGTQFQPEGVGVGYRDGSVSRRGVEELSLFRVVTEVSGRHHWFDASR